MGSWAGALGVLFGERFWLTAKHRVEADGTACRKRHIGRDRPCRCILLEPDRLHTRLEILVTIVKAAVADVATAASDAGAIADTKIEQRLLPLQRRIANQQHTADRDRCPQQTLPCIHGAQD